MQVDEGNRAYSLAVLIDGFRSEEAQTRLNSVRKLSVIAKALGPARTRNELIPFLTDFVDDDDDVPAALAEELAKLVPLTGGPEFGHLLLPPLETLACVEESSIREKAVEGIVAVCGQIPPQTISGSVMQLIARLSGGEWYTSRMASVPLFAVVYSRVSEQQRQELRTRFVELCRDETPMVRRAVGVSFPNFCEQVDAKFVKADLLPAFARLAVDDQDSVRLLAVDCCVKLGQILPAEDRLRFVYPIVRSIAGDKSWRVRYIVADKFSEICKLFGRDDVKAAEELVEAFVSLLKDQEAEVRTAAASRVSDVAMVVGPKATLERLIPLCKVLVEDSSQYTRAALAKVVMNMAAILRKEDVYDHLLQIFLQLLKDPDSDVRLNVISKLGTVNQVIGVELLQKSLLQAISQLAGEPKWRVRLAVIEHIPLLAAQLGRPFFTRPLTELCMAWLGDKVFAIRQAATQNITKLASIFGEDWSRQEVVPRIQDLCGNKCYLYRMTAVYLIGELAGVHGPQFTGHLLLPFLLALSSDIVPNVCFNVAKTLDKIMPNIPQDLVASAVKPCLRKLANDQDSDVQFFARKALSSLPN